MMLKSLLKKIGVFCLSFVFGLWTLFSVLFISVRADSLSWGLDLVGINDPLVDLLAAYDIFPILSAGGSIELSKFNTYDDWKEWWSDEMTSRISTPSDIQESLQAGVDAYRVAGSTALSDQDSLFAKINQRYLAMQIGYAKDFVDSVAVPADPVPTPAPSPDFSFISNSVDFYSNGVPLVYSNYPYARVSGSTYYDTLTFEWSKVSYYADTSLDHIASSSRNFYDRVSVFDGIITISFDSSSNTAVYSNTSFLSPLATGLSGNTFEHLQIRGLNNTTYRSSWGYSSRSYSFQTSFAGLSTAINYFYSHFANFNLYVDGVPWVLVSTITPVDTVSFPDVIRTGDGDLAYDLVVPDTISGDAFFDLTSLLSRIYDMINDNSSTADKTLTLEDVQDLIVDEEGTQVATKTVVVSKVISDSLDITGSPPAPSGTPFDHPVLYFPPVDSGSGSSILAELIHATDVALPDDLMLAVWGALGALFVLGVIHILHK